jgi:ribulose-phosphate 3-epimerase
MIIPGILEPTLQEIEQKIRQVEKEAKCVQIDVADGEFVPNKTYLEIRDILELKTSVPYDIHLMVDKPEKYIQACLEYPHKVCRISTQIEAEATADLVLKEAKKEDILVGLSINPHTPLEKINEHLEGLDFVQLMSVQPGAQGQPFIPQTLEKIKEAKERFPSLKVQIDGGTNGQNLLEVLKAGADDVVIGSAIFGARSPLEALQNFERIEEKWKSKTK